MHTHDLTLGLAFGLGALHALEPGHGKTAMLVYFAENRKSLLHPLVVGVSSAVSHSVSLVAIAAVVHLAHHLMTGDHHHENHDVTQLLRWISAGLVLVVGVWMTWSAWKSNKQSCGCCHHETGIDASDKSRSAQPSSGSFSMSALLGIAFGLLPCPSAMAAYFSGMSDGSPITAYAVIALFAAGIASSLTLVGIAIQKFGGRMPKNESWISSLPWPFIRAGLITTVGLFYLGRVATS